MAPPTGQKPQPTTPAWEVLNKDGTPAGQNVNLQFGADPNEVWRVANLVGERVAKDLRADVEKVRTDMSARLDTHEKRAAEAADAALLRDEQILDRLDRLTEEVGALAGRVSPLELEVERDKWRAEGAREARADMSGVRPSPLVVMPSPAVAAPAPPPAPASWLQDWTPNKLLVLVGMVSAAMSGAAVDWPAIVRELVRGVAGTP